MTIETSASGSVMICGEHAVVYGQPAIVAAIAQQIRVRLTPRNDDKITIHSALGDYESTAGFLKPYRPLAFVIACLERYPHSGGLTLEIDSAIDPTLGLGSSAAVTVATLAALARHTGEDERRETLHTQALTIVRSLQSRGSGADLAASLWGGMIAYRNLPEVSVSALPLPPVDVGLRYSGYKTPTDVVLYQIAEKMRGSPDFYAQLYQTMGETAAHAIAAAEHHHWQDFYAALARYQQHMEELGVCDDTLAAMIAAARAHPDTLASKISGSGLGDCIISFAKTLPADHQKITIDMQGVQFIAG